jgi:hypothetical protein
MGLTLQTSSRNNEVFVGLPTVELDLFWETVDYVVSTAYGIVSSGKVSLSPLSFRNLLFCIFCSTILLRDCQNDDRPRRLALFRSDYRHYEALAYTVTKMVRHLKIALPSSLSASADAHGFLRLLY